MVKPIEPTPTLYGKDAVRFLRKMIKEQEHPSAKRIKIIEEAMKCNFKVTR